MAKISIIIPVYNVEQYIEKCIESVVNQTFSDIEIIIVNDGTQDSSIKRIKRFIDSDKRIKLINKENGGLMSAWKNGVKEATGDYIGFVDSDDWIDADYYEFLYNKITETQSDIVVGKYVFENPDYRKELFRSSDHTYSGKQIIEELMPYYYYGFTLNDNIISYCRWDKLYKRELILNNMEFFDERISLGEDVNANSAIIPDAQKITIFSISPLYHYRLNSTSIVNTFNPKQIDNVFLLYSALREIAAIKGLETEPIKAFIGDIVYNHCLSIMALQCSNSEKYQKMTYISGYEFVDDVLLSCSKHKGRAQRIFINCVLKKKYGICLLMSKAYTAFGKKS